MAQFFIARPVFAIVTALVILLAGGIAGLQLPIAQYPQITLPTVVVSATYPGASAQTVEQSVAQPIEEQVNGVEGMLYMESTSSSAGTYRLNVTFGLGRNADTAAVQVQNRVAQANARLPSEVTAAGVTTSKSTPDTLLYGTIYSPKGSYDSLFLSNYLNINIVEAIKRIDGVGSVQVFGSDFGMRIWLRPDRMAQLGITTSDVANAIREQNVQAPAGQVGQYPSPPNQAFQYGVEVHGRLVTAEEFGNIIVKAQPDGSLVHVRDLARVELGAKDYSVQARYNGQPTASFGVNLTPEASAVAVSKAIRSELAQLAKTFPPDLAYAIVVDKTVFVTASLDEVVKTLGESLVLVMLVVFLFLQNWRATVIPLLAVPVSLVGTLAAFIVLGFTLNTLTLFGMVLAIGIVVDDAIVVVEAVEHHIQEGMAPRAATEQAMRDVSGPVVAVALVLAAVFVPVAFLGGIAGALYRQFAVTVAVSTLLSAFVALSLTPALCAMLLKPAKGGSGVHKRGPFGAFNRGFDRVLRGYTRTVGFAIGRMAIALLVLVAFTVGAVLLFRQVPSAFVPPEDQGFLIGAVALPEAAALDRTMAATEKLDGYLAKTPGGRAPPDRQRLQHPQQLAATERCAVRHRPRAMGRAHDAGDEPSRDHRRDLPRRHGHSGGDGHSAESAAAAGAWRLRRLQPQAAGSQAAARRSSLPPSPTTSSPRRRSARRSARSARGSIRARPRTTSRSTAKRRRRSACRSTTSSTRCRRFSAACR